MVHFKEIQTSLAWSFTHLIPGTFKRNKMQFALLDYPILAPLPTARAKTQPIEPTSGFGPFIYFVVDASSTLCYVGKSQEESVLKRWIRPGNGGPTTHYWTHSTKGGGSVFNIAEGLRRAQGPYSLHVSTLDSLLAKFGQTLQFNPDMPTEDVLTEVENFLIREMQPAWNH
jgi:hypothetical protein